MAMKSFWFPGAPEKVTVMVCPEETVVGEAVMETPALLGSVISTTGLDVSGDGESDGGLRGEWQPVRKKMRNTKRKIFNFILDKNIYTPSNR